MPVPTNKLVSKTARIAVPAGVAAALILGAAFFVQHNGVQAAYDPPAPAAAPLPASSVAPLVSLDDAVEAVAARVTPAVVNVAVTSRSSEQSASDQDQGQAQGLPPGFWQFFGQGGPFGQMQQQQPQIEHGIGSGVIISPDGYILTNNHVVNGAVDLRVTLDDRRTFNGKVVGVDKLTDLAVIKIDAKNLPSIPWGDSTKLRPGQTVLAFGSPFGYFQFSVTRGIVSALDRPNPYADDPRKPGGFIQTDAAINPGNSGGPLVDAYGQLVGINTFIITSNGSFAGAGFAIPSQIARVVADSLIKNGVMHHGYLGISMNDVTPDNYNFFKLPKPEGAIIAQVTPDSPASRAGLRSGDVIDSLDGTEIPNGSALQVAVSEDAPGKTIALGIFRNGEQQTVDVKVGEFHGANNEVATNANGGAPTTGKLGLSVANLTPDVRQQLNVPAGVNGVAVENVRPASPADEAGLAPGDLILEVDRHPVTSAQAFANDVHSSPAGKDLLLLVWSQGNAYYRVLHTDEGTQNGM